MATIKPTITGIDSTTPENSIVRTGIKTVATATGQDDPDRMEVINTVQGRLRSRMSDARDSAMRKLRKTNNTVGEEHVAEIFGWGKKKEPPEPKDQSAAMHHVLVHYGYERTQQMKNKLGYVRDDVKYTHPSGKYARINAKKIHRDSEHNLKLGGAETIHSSGKRFTSAKDLDDHLKQIHEEVVTEMDNPQQKIHRVQVMVTSASKKEPAFKHVRVGADDKDEAVCKARLHYAKKGYRVKQANHVGMVDEYGRDVKEETEMDNEHLDNMVNSLINNRPGEFTSALAAEMIARSVEVIDIWRQDLAQTMFNQQTEDGSD